MVHREGSSRPIWRGLRGPWRGLRVPLEGALKRTALTGGGGVGAAIRYPEFFTLVYRGVWCAMSAVHVGFD